MSGWKVINSASMMNREKCPHCGQDLPPRTDEEKIARMEECMRTSVDNSIEMWKLMAEVANKKK
jgi:hypothetical protein